MFLMSDLKSFSEENIDQELTDEELKDVSGARFWMRGKSLNSGHAWPWGNPFTYAKKSVWSWFSSWW